jgi:hypothetical protein
LATARALISASIASIAMDVDMAHQFDESFNLLRHEIRVLNDKMTRMFDLLRIPFEVSLVPLTQPKTGNDDLKSVLFQEFGPY